METISTGGANKKPWDDIILNNGNIAYCLFQQSKYQEAIRQCEVTIDLINKYQPDNSSRDSYREMIRKCQHIVKTQEIDEGV